MTIFCDIWEKIRLIQKEQRQKQKQAERRIKEPPGVCWQRNLETCNITNGFEEKIRQKQKQKKRRLEILTRLHVQCLTGACNHLFWFSAVGEESNKTYNRKAIYLINQTQQYITLFYFGLNGSTVLDVQLRCFQPSWEELVVETERRIHKN